MRTYSELILFNRLFTENWKMNADMTLDRKVVN